MIVDLLRCTGFAWLKSPPTHDHSQSGLSKSGCPLLSLLSGVPLLSSIDQCTPRESGTSWIGFFARVASTGPINWLISLRTYDGQLRPILITACDVRIRLDHRD